MKTKILVEHEIETAEGEPLFCSSECQFYNEGYCQLFSPYSMLNWYQSISEYARHDECLNATKEAE
jgi:hypothetical protein